MRRRSSQKKQGKKGKGPGKLLRTWWIFRLVASSFLKFSFVLISLVVISMLFLSLYGYLLSSPHIRLEQVVFEGIDEQMKNELLTMSDLNFDLSLLAIDMNELKQTMEKHPWVRSVDMEKRFPHTLVIWVEKEEPWAVVVQDKLYYMNRWGGIFKEVAAGENFDYPVITGIAPEGDEREKDLHYALQVLKSLSPETAPWSLDNLSEIHVRERGDVSLYFSSLPVVVNLKGEDLAEKMDDLKRLVEHLEKTGRIHMVRGINLNYRDAAVVAFKKG